MKLSRQTAGLQHPATHRHALSAVLLCASSCPQLLWARMPTVKLETQAAQVVFVWPTTGHASTQDWKDKSMSTTSRRQASRLQQCLQQGKTKSPPTSLAKITCNFNIFRERRAGTLTDASRTPAQLIDSGLCSEHFRYSMTTSESGAFSAHPPLNLGLQRSHGSQNAKSRTLSGPVEVEQRPGNTWTRFPGADFTRSPMPQESSPRPTKEHLPLRDTWYPVDAGALGSLLLCRAKARRPSDLDPIGSKTSPSPHSCERERERERDRERERERERASERASERARERGGGREREREGDSADTDCPGCAGSQQDPTPCM